jgi:hypothetical protein
MWRRYLLVPSLLIELATDAYGCPGGYYRDATTQLCLPTVPRPSVLNAPSDINRGVSDIMKGKAPPPAQLGTVGGKRVCIPWC